MPFRVKNLMISVIPQVADNPPHGNPLGGGYYTCAPYSLTRTEARLLVERLPAVCESPTYLCPTHSYQVQVTPTITTTRTVSYACVEFQIDFGDIEALTLLKAQLDAQINALNAQLAPQTVEEAETLEGHLTEALNEVKATKETLRKAKK